MEMEQSLLTSYHDSFIIYNTGTYIYIYIYLYTYTYIHIHIHITYLPFGWLPLRQHNQRRTIDIKNWIHRTSTFLPPRQGQPHVHPIPHTVHGERLKNRMNDIFLRMDVLKSEGLGALEEPFEVSFEG